MKKGIFTVQSNTPIAKDVFEMRLSGDSSAVERPGQFINIALDGFYLRRPISVCDYYSGGILIIYKAVGQGTKYMAALKEGAKLDVLTGLGNGFNIGNVCGNVILCGGGVGTPPLYRLAKELISSGCKVTAALGFNSACDVFYTEHFERLGVKTLVATVDATAGKGGFVTDLFEPSDYSYYFACGPEPMLKAVYDKLPCSGQLSFEERMGCGFGACMGCSCKTKYGNKRICKDGPVLCKEEIIW